MGTKMANDKIYIFDTTLRDGEQSPGCSMNLKEKLDVATHLEALKVDCIEAGFAISSKGDFEAIKAISAHVSYPSVCSLCRAVEQDINLAAESVENAKKPRIHTFIATSPIHMKYKLKMTEEQVLERAVKAVTYAKTFVEDVEFSCEDAGRSNPEFLARVFTEVIKAGATVVNVPDTVGYMMPNEYGALIEYLANHVEGIENVIMSVHCHDDLGVATANSLAGILNGARQIECTINGIGERAGNTALEEVVMAMAVRPDFFPLHTDVNTKEISKISRLVSHITGSVIQANKAIVGANAFAHEAGIHQDGVLKQKSTYEIMAPEMVGLSEKALVLGKHSGRHAFLDRLRELGYELDPEELQKAFERFKAIADKKKDVLEEDLHALISDEIYQHDDFYKLDYFEVNSTNKSKPTATVKLLSNGNVITGTSEGAGSVDAIYKAIDSLVEETIDLKEYTLQSITGGTDALGEVVVRIKDQGRVFVGRSSSTDVLNSSAKAYVYAINKMLNARGINRIKPAL
jgi:2-isopropylmalate synthase